MRETLNDRQYIAKVASIVRFSKLEQSDERPVERQAVYSKCSKM